MAELPPKRKLLVEGSDEKRVIPQLMEKNGVLWGETKETAIVTIKECGGVGNLLEPGGIEAELKESNLKQMGIIVDADANAEGRWQSLRDHCLTAFPDFPITLQDEGYVEENATGLRLGVWVMPDNRSVGMLETFLKHLVPSDQDPIYEHAVKSTSIAEGIGASFSKAHVDKAIVHAWLAWQDPPGRQMHQAVLQKILDPTAEYAQPFVKWFKRLYQL